MTDHTQRLYHLAEHYDLLRRPICCGLIASCIYRAQSSVRLSSVLRFLAGTISPPLYLFLVCAFAMLQAAQDHLPDTIPTHTKFRCPNAFITFFIQVHFPYAVTDRPSLPVFIDLLRRDSCNAVYLTGCKIRAYDLSSLNISQGVPVFSTLLHISFPPSSTAHRPGASFCVLYNTAAET